MNVNNSHPGLWRYLWHKPHAKLYAAVFVALLLGSLLLGLSVEKWWSRLDALAGLSALFVTMLLFTANNRREWEDSLPKRMKSVFLYPPVPGEEPVPLAVVDNIPLFHEADLRNLGQQAGMQLFGQHLVFGMDIEKNPPVTSEKERVRDYVVVFKLRTLPAVPVEAGGGKPKEAATAEQLAQAGRLKAQFTAATDARHCVYWDAGSGSLPDLADARNWKKVKAVRVQGQAGPEWQFPREVILTVPPDATQARPERHGIANLTQHEPTPEQAAAGVVNLAAEAGKRVRLLLTFNEPPFPAETERRAQALAREAWHAGYRKALIGGALWLMAPLEAALRRHGVEPLYAFTLRQACDVPQPDGSVKREAVFRHAGFVKGSGHWRE